MRFCPEEIDEYCSRYSQPDPQWLLDLEKETKETMELPQMLSGHLAGRALKTLVQIMGARKVLEIGTYTGYSALCFAEGLPEDGKVVTCDVDPKTTALAQKYFDKTPHGKKIEIKLGPALDTIAKLDDTFDLVFIDADKVNYKNYYEASMPLLRKGGLFVFDNCLWSGRVLRPVEDSAVAIHAVNEALSRDERVENVVLPIRDGWHLARKC